MTRRGILFASIVCLLAGALPAAAATITVTTTADELITNGTCSLREAIRSANLNVAVDACTAGSGAEEIVLPAGVYTLTIAGARENAALTGDLDVTGTLTITGAGAGATITEGCAVVPPATSCTGIDRVFDVQPGATLTINRVTIRHGTDVQEGLGGGIRNQGALTLTDSVVTDNVSSLAGGGLRNSGAGSATLIRTIVSGNRAPSGGGISSLARLVVSDSLVSDNAATDTFGLGGGILSAGPATITTSTIAGNTAVGGGGINNLASMTIIRSTVNDNTATGNGGGLVNGGGTVTTLTVINSTVSGNSAGEFGGGLHSGGNTASTLTVINTTVTANTTPGRGGGLHLSAGTLNLRNTILAGNFDTSTASGFHPDCSVQPGRVVTSQGYNLVGDGTECAGIADGVNGDRAGTAENPIDPRLTSLADHGGPTLTHALLADSLAIDTGDPAGCTDETGAPLAVDQRGFPRPDPPGGRCDIGAFEAANAAPIAGAGPDQTVDERVRVTLDGSGSHDPNGDALSYQWTQIAGPLVTLDLTDPVRPTFVAPVVSVGGATLAFELTVSDGSLSSQDAVDITIKNVNGPPVADAGADQTVGEGATVTLHGENSYDPDGESVTYAWLQTTGPPVALSGAGTAQATFTAPLVGAAGVTLTFALRASDGIDSATDTVSVVVENVNHAPTADAGADQTKAEGSEVMLDGNASRDPDGDPLTYLWTQVSGPTVALSGAETDIPTFVAPPVGPGGATLVFQLRVDDGLGGQATDEASVLVQNVNDPPACEAARPSPSSLWPPNHKLMLVRIVGVSDPDNNPVTVTTIGVTQDEPVNGLGDGDTSPDAMWKKETLLLRAERAGGGNGRVYRVRFQATDGQGGSCTGAVTVCVLHDRGHGKVCVDDGQQYDSAQP